MTETDQTDEVTGNDVITRGPDWTIAPSGVTVLQVADPADVALAVAEAIKADLILPDEIDETIAGRRHDALQRQAARDAVAVYDQIHAKVPTEIHVIADTDELRRLAGRLGRAATVVDETNLEVKRRFGGAQGQDIAVHPDTIRRAATGLLGARSAVESLAAEIASMHRAPDEGDPWGDDSVDVSGADAFSAEVDAEDERKLDAGRFGRPKRGKGIGKGAASSGAVLAGSDGSGAGRSVESGIVVRGIVGVVAATAVAVLVTAVDLVAYGLGFILPILAAIWAVGQVRDNRTDTADRSMAADNLAAVGAITDQAYGGSLDTLRPGDDDVDPSAETDAAIDDGSAALRARLQSATTRLNQFESEWVSLVGPDADPDDIDGVLRTRDAQYQLTDAQLHATPSVRAAARYQRRLSAKWKLAWSALDQSPPSLDEAHAAIDALEADEVYTASVERFRSVTEDDDARHALLTRYDELSDGRGPDEVRAAADERLLPVVVADEYGNLDGDELAARVGDLLSELQVVLVSR